MLGAVKSAKGEIESGVLPLYGKRVLTMATQEGKGWFAILITKLIDHDTHIPPYLIEAIFAAHGPLDSNILSNMLDYRLRCIESSGIYGADEVAHMRQHVSEFREGRLDRAGVRAAMLAAFPADRINDVLARV